MKSMQTPLNKYIEQARKGDMPLYSFAGIEIPLDFYINHPQILDTISDAVIIYDSSLRVVIINKRACETLDIKAEEWVGKTPEQYVKEGYIDRSIIYDAIQSRQEVSGIVYTRKGAEYLSRCCPVYDADGNLKFIVATTFSLTDFDNLKIKLQEERSKTEKYRREVEYLRKYIMVANDHIFQSEDMHGLIEFVKKVAPLDCTVLISGESGVGKEVLAKTIHSNSPRSCMPFVTVSIPAIPENLLEAELFGYEEGAFTGSKRGGKLGLFEMAQGGTLFLDEIGDVPLSIQVKLLRAIDNSEITRVGGTKTRKLDVRILSATNKNLADEVKKGLFREDLFYRLNVVPFVVSPLRTRRGVIIPLCLHFLKSNNLKYKFNKTFSAEALEELQKYHWPGNIRQLKNVIEQLAIFYDYLIITGENVREVLYNQKGQDKDAVFDRHEDKPDPIADKSRDNKSPLSEYQSYEKARILDALKQADGSKTKAAQIMGMSRTRLYRKLNKYS